ncbi:MAG: MFS transporter, partial [Desulfobacterales bacterium]
EQVLQERRADIPFDRLQLIVVAWILLAGAVGFTLLFSLSALEGLWLEGVVTKSALYGRQVQQRIKHKIDQSQALDSCRDGTNCRFEDQLTVWTGSGLLLKETKNSPQGTSLLWEKYSEFKSSKEKRDLISGCCSHSRYENFHFVCLDSGGSAESRYKNWIVGFDHSLLDAEKNRLVKKLWYPAAFTFFFGAGLLTLCLLVVPLRLDEHLGRKKKRITLILFVPIAVAQIFICTLSCLVYRDLYLELGREKINRIETILNEYVDVRSASSRQTLSEEQVFELLNRFMPLVPELESVVVFDNNLRPLVAAQTDKVLRRSRLGDDDRSALIFAATQASSSHRTISPLGSRHSPSGYYVASISESEFWKRFRTVAVDYITGIVISFLFLVEMLILVSQFINDRKKRSAEAPIHYSIIRPAAFLFLFGIDISISFLPLHMETLYEPFMGLSKEVIMGLPISTEFFCVGIAILFSGVWLDRRGWHQPFITGLFLAGVGVLYSWLAPNALQFILSRAVVGLGYGLALMASQGFVIANSDDNSKASGLAHLFAGIYCGSLCGGAAGALIAERIGYEMVFLIGAVVLFAVILYTVVFMRNTIKKPQAEARTSIAPSVRVGSIWRFLTNRKIVSLMIFSSLPASIAVIGFMNYFSPIYLNRAGESQSTIGRVMMIYGICLIYVGPFISKYVDAAKDKRLFIFCGCLLGSAAFLVFNIIEGLLAAAVAILLLGLSSSLVLPAQSAYALKIKVTNELGCGKAIGIFRASSRIGQVAGPVIFGWLIMAANIERGMTYFGCAYFLTALLFFLLTRSSQTSETVGGENIWEDIPVQPMQTVNKTAN